MKKHLLAATAVAAFAVAAPALAEAPAPTAWVGASYTNNQIDYGFGDYKAEAYGLNGAIAFHPVEALGVQIDGSAADTDFDGGYEMHTWSLGGHAFVRNDSYAVGAFLQGVQYESNKTYNFGVEGAKYLDNVTVAGALGYGKFQDVDVHYWALNGEARYFVSDNIRVQGGAAWDRFSFFGTDADAWSLGFGGEYQFDQAPVSVYANYAYTKQDDLDVSNNAFTIGVRYNFGGGSLKARDRKGASFTGVSDLGAALVF